LLVGFHAASSSFEKAQVATGAIHMASIKFPAKVKTESVFMRQRVAVVFDLPAALT
jgi:hypothetical protein